MSLARSTSRLEAEVAIPAAREQVFAYLARLENHWQLADRWIEVAHLDSNAGERGPINGGAVRVRGPLGVSRTVRTRVVGVEAPGRIHGHAEIGSRTRAAVDWSLAGEGSVTRVRLAAEIEALGPLDRVLWAAGGRLWMERRFERVLDGLRRRFAARA